MLVEIEALPQACLAESMIEETRLQVEVIGFKVFRREDELILLASKSELQGLDDRARDLILDRKDVLQLPIV